LGKNMNKGKLKKEECKIKNEERGKIKGKF
jgi:hypothetical protein